LKLKEKEMKKIPWKYDESGSKSYVFSIGGLSFSLYWDLGDGWYLSGIAGHYSPIKYSSEEKANEKVIEVIEKYYKEFKEFFE
jgi:hypothetical protein